MPQRAQDPTAPASEPEADSPHASNPAADSTTSSTDGTTPGDAFRDVGPRLAEMAEYLNYFISAKLDRIVASVRKAGVYAVLGIAGLLALCAFIVTAVVLLCVGVAGMLGAAFGGRAWAGNLSAAILFLLILATGGWFGYRKLTRSWRERTIKKYAQRQQQQRAQFGIDVAQRSRKPTE